MSLQLVLGNSGSGKSTWLYDYVVAQAIKFPKKNFIFLVPEQFTLQTQKEFVNRHPSHSILNIDVLSFRRLAYRVFDELGMMDLAVLEETGKNLALRKVASEQEDGLVLLKRNIHKTGYISELKSLLSELMQYHVTIEDIANAKDALETKSALWYKLSDILTLYQSFCDFTQGRYLVADEIEDLLTQVADESGMLKGSVVILDGYTGFTPVQLRFLETLFPLAHTVMAAVTIDVREPVVGEPKVQELFYLSKKTIQSLYKIAKTQGIEIQEPVVLGDGNQKRYKQAPALFHLEQNLFRRYAATYTNRKENESNVQDAITICSFFQPKDELYYVAAEIKRCVARTGCRYKDIAVVTGDVPSYANYAEEIFELYHIPLFVDQKKNILFHPFIEMIRAVLEMETSDYSYESVMRFFRSGLSGLSTDLVDLLENYLLAFGIRGWSRWKKSWVRPADWLKEAELEQLNEKRDEFLRFFTPFHMVFHKKKATLLEMTAALYQLLDDLDVQTHIQEQKEQFEAAGMLAQAKENEQIYGIVIDLFDKMVELLGDTCIARKEYAQILDAGLEAAQVGIIPPGYDRVLFGDIERTRLEHIKVLFFVGVNDGIIPKNEVNGGILSEFEREKLTSFHFELAPTSRERSFIQKYYLYLNVTKPSQRLYLTYAKAGQEGQARKESYFIHAVQKLFPQIKLYEPEESAVSTADSSMKFFLSGLAAAKQGKALEEWKALYAWYLRHKPWADLAASYVDAAFYRHKDAKLDTALTHKLYGTILENSVTRLERFASCAFAHFLQYGLQLSQRQINEFASVDFGNILHHALEQYAKRMEEGGDDWFHITKEHQSQYAAQAIDLAIASCNNTALLDGARNLYLVKRMEIGRAHV